MTTLSAVALGLITALMVAGAYAIGRIRGWEEGRLKAMQEFLEGQPVGEAWRPDPEDKP